MTEHFKPADKQLWFSALKDRFNLFKQSRKSQLMGVDLRYAHLEDHDLSGRQRQGAYLLDAFLNNTNLDGANLQGCESSSGQNVKLPAIGKGEELAAGRLHSCLKRGKQTLVCACQPSRQSTGHPATAPPMP